MKIGLLSDTHSYLDPKVFEHFGSCDEIWHAGHIGAPAVADALEKVKPLRAVDGNIDDKSIQSRFPEDLHVQCEGLAAWITHMGGLPRTIPPGSGNNLPEQQQLFSSAAILTSSMSGPTRA